MSNLLWANLINMYQPPNCDRSELEKIVNKSYLPLLRALGQNPEHKFSLNIPGCTVDLLIRTGFGQVIKKIAELADKGQIDFAATPKYQPLIPFLSDDDIDRQIEANNKIGRRYFGVAYVPKGLYSPFLAYSQAVAKAAARFGLKWVALDEISFSNGASNGFSSLYMDKSAGGVVLMPRHRELSDLLEGNLWARKVPRTSAEFVQAAMQKCGNDKYFITISDAENFGYLQAGRFSLLKSLYSEPRLKKVTFSELKFFVKKKEFVRPVDGASESRLNDIKRKKPFLAWENENNVVQQTLWQLFNLTTAEIRNAGAKGDAQFIRAREMYDSASAGINWLMASGSPWWNSAYPLQAADDMAIAVFVLLSSSPKVKDNAIAQRQKIYDNIEQLEKSGDVKKWQKNYLRANNIPFEKFFNNHSAEPKEKEAER